MEGLIAVRRMALHDLDAVLAIQVESPSIAQWTRDDYASATETPEFRCWVAARAGAVCAFVVTRTAADELEVLNIAVARNARRQGAATGLLEAAFAEARANGIESAFLEVRESNAQAVSFYARLGFHETARRAKYYRDPVEDALILSRHLGV